MNTLKFIIVVSIALLGTDLIYHQVVNAQGQNQTGKEEMSMFEEMERYFSLEPILNYCYEHASDSANPVQDLRDKGLLDYSQGEDYLMNGPTTYYNYTTCAEVKQESDRLNDYAEQMWGK